MKIRLLPRVIVYGLIPLCAFLYAHFLEPFWVLTKTFTLSDNPTVRVVHISDTHYKGEREYLSKVVNHINSLNPDVVCFTGDLAEEDPYYEQALDVLSGLSAPLVCAPGNHDPFVGDGRRKIDEACRSLGGAYLVDSFVTFTNLGLTISGTESPSRIPGLDEQQPLSIVITHYPEIAAKIDSESIDLVLAGHSHGGQVRLPFIGALILPDNVGSHDIGLDRNRVTPLYVNPGLGTFVYRIRFLCRPEITVFNM